ncbi:integrase catalytic domain-containing protein [Trichonephila clavipes]|nr:integrase catalytic domain-containing protein [Trichonephila clavipes]
MTTKSHPKTVRTQATIKKVKSLILKISAQSKIHCIETRNVFRYYKVKLCVSILRENGVFRQGKALRQHPKRERCSNTGWKSLLKLRQHFWDRWHKEVLHHYQSRPKRKASQSEVQVGNLVLISDDNRPPLSWSMARILKLIPGTDGTNRVAILQTGSGLTRRSINKIVVLPVCALEDGDSEIHH